MRELKIKGRIYVEVPVDDVSVNDVVEYFDSGIRWRPVTAFRRGSRSAVRVRDVVGRVKWIPIGSVRSAWRWHRRQQASLF